MFIRTSVKASRRRQPLAAFGVVVLCLLLAACGSRPPNPSVSRSPSATPVRAGQDGAPLDPPADLAAIPDATPRVEPIRKGGPNKPYEVLGQSYAPITEDLPFTQKGKASWYGTKFHGRRTASGEAYSMYGMTAAHRTLPIPSYVKVRSLDNGREVVVRVNDRGPFHGDRILDLSYTAALKLGLLAKGSGPVEIQRLTFEQISRGDFTLPAPQLAAAVTPKGPAPSPVAPIAAAGVPAGSDTATDSVLALASRLDEGVRPSPTARIEPSVGQARALTPYSKGWWVQLAAFSSQAGLEDFQKRVAQDVAHLAPLLAVYQDGRLWRLQVGPFEARDDAQGVARKVRDTLSLVPVVVERR